MLSARLNLILLVSAFAFACNDASFSGSSSSPQMRPTPSPVPTPQLTPPPQTQDAAVATPTPAAPPCVNSLKQGLTDATGHHFKWVGYVSACQGYVMCRQLGPTAQVIWANMVMPDAVQSCNQFLNYWYQNYPHEFDTSCTPQGAVAPEQSNPILGGPALNLDIVVGGGDAVPLTQPGDIICTY